MNAIKYFIFIVFLCSQMAYGFSWGDNWRGFIYPNKHDLTVSKFVGQFDSLEACRAKAKSELESLNATDSGDYECGLNCKKSKYGIEVCKKTLK